MLRFLFTVATVAATVAQQQNATQCGATTGVPCPSPSASPPHCCIDAARCMGGQQLCPTPSPSVQVSRLPCCTDPSKCTAGRPLCPSPPPGGNYTDTTQWCCDTAECFNMTALPPCPSLTPWPTPRPSIPASPSASYPVAASPTNTMRVVPSADPTERVQMPEPSAEPTQRSSQRPELSPEPTKRMPPPEPSSEPTQRSSQRPEPSSEPTQRSSQRPEPSSEPTHRSSQRPENTPKPTERPVQPSSSAAPTRRPTIRPAATFLIRGSRLPAPSRWPAPANYTPAANFGAITGTIRLPNANNTAVVLPANLQQITANIACALRQPLETIQINNITTRYQNGTVNIVKFDAAANAIESGGVPVCLTTIVARRLRSLQDAMEATVTIIQYVIVDPSANLLALDSATFNTLMAADPAIISIAEIVGSSGVGVTAPEELSLTAAAPSPAGTPGNSGSQISIESSIYIAVGVMGAVGIVSMYAGFVVIYMRTRGRPAVQLITPHKPAKLIVLDTDNPLMISKSKDVRITNERNAFVPQGARV